MMKPVATTCPAILAKLVLSLAMIALLGAGPAADAATIRVARDGSGDYASLFDALAAAQDGDTVSVGPGEYTETQIINPSGSYEFESMGLISASNVAVIGDDRDGVLIGPSVPPPVLNSSGILGPGANLGAIGVTFSNLTFRNLSRAIWDSDGAISVDRCRFTGNYWGVVQVGLGECVISNSEFVGNLNVGIIAFRGFGSRSLTIENCTFVDTFEAMQIQNPQTTVSNCTFSGGSLGITSALGGQVIVQDCTFTDIIARGVHISDGTVMWLYNNIFQGEMEYNVFVAGGALLGGGNLLSGGSVVTLLLGNPDYLDFWGNHILNGGGLSVDAGNGIQNPRTLSLESNWWGTGDAAQIEDWIDHAPDDPTRNGLTIDYLPFYGGPVPTEESSIGQLKGKFSGY